MTETSFEKLDEVAEGLAGFAVDALGGQRDLSAATTEAFAQIIADLQLVHSLAERVKVLEQRPELKHAGVWHEGKTYRGASLVTHPGSLRLAKKGNRQRPGQSAAWVLIVKSGDAA